jgi:D-arabinitol 4-dehydrogenase
MKLFSAQLERASFDAHLIKPGILHLGFGAFHRAHQALYFENYMDKTGDLNWGIIAVNLRAAESPSFNAFFNSNSSYILKTTSPTGEEKYRLIQSHIGHTDWVQNATEAEALFAQSTIKAATITVTESGYYLGDDGRSLNFADPTIEAEIRGGKARSVYAYLARALEQRRQKLNLPITIICCDNIRANGKMLKTNLLAYLTKLDQSKLCDWVKENVSFPCTMVDRITPRADDEFVRQMQSLFPTVQSNPVRSEAFTQWVLEDNFAGPMADLTVAGVEIVKDVDPYEEAKIRILNGGHSGLCYLGALAGHTTFDQAMADPKLRKHFDGWEQENVLPGLTRPLPFDKHQYCDDVANRFCNAAIADNLERICMDGWSKMPIYIRPTIASCLDQGISPTYGYDCIASWYVYARRFDKGQMQVKYHEPYWEQLKPLLQPAKEEAFARTTALWDNLPEQHQEFVPSLVSAIKKLEASWPV